MSMRSMKRRQHNCKRWRRQQSQQLLFGDLFAARGQRRCPATSASVKSFTSTARSYSQIGYEFDGIPVNRAFDNYNASSLSNLGVVSTEVYTAVGRPPRPSATLGGYINQIIKTGTFPGYATIGAGIGSPGFYHLLQLEAGGATPDRNLSWYVGLRGDN